MTVLQELSKTKIEDENGSSVGLVVGGCMENISAHGIPNIKRAIYTSRRLVWLCAFFISFSICVWQVTLLTNAYVSRQTTTNSDVNVATTLIFPAVTICNMNGMRVSYLHDNKELYDNIRQTADRQEDQFMEWTNSDTSTREGYFDMISYVTEYLAQIPYYERENAGHNISNTMLSCNFNGYPCLPSNFSYSYNYLYGNCYTFNDGRTYPISNTSYSGPLYGLTVEFNIEQDEYISDIQPAAGLRVVIHDHKEMPFPEDVGVTVSPGKETSIAIHRTEYTRLASPYPSNCSSSNVKTLFSEMFPNIEYSKAACFKNCVYYQTFEHCECYNSRYVLDYTTEPVCTIDNDTQEDCILMAEQYIAEGKMECYCEPPCSEISYTTSTSSALWPGKNYLPTIMEKFSETPDLNNDNDTESYISTNFVKVNVYYENLQFDAIVQVPTYTLLSLISNVGGHLGLWIGMSALTLLECLECIYDILKHSIAALVRRRKQKKTKPMDADKPATIVLSNKHYSGK